MMIPEARSGETARIDRDLQAKTGQQMRTMYTELVQQELPEKLRELIRRLSGQQLPQ